MLFSSSAVFNIQNILLNIIKNYQNIVLLKHLEENKKTYFTSQFQYIWQAIETNRKIHKCVLVFKCLHNLVPQYLSNYFIRNYNVHGYNTRRKADLHLPKPKLSLGKRTFTDFLAQPFLIHYLVKSNKLYHSPLLKILSKPILFIAPNL